MMRGLAIFLTCLLLGSAASVRAEQDLIFPRSGGHLSKLGMIRAEVMDGEYSTSIHG
jgi:hypothetical protein